MPIPSHPQNIWCPRSDSNRHDLVSKTSTSYQLGYLGKTFGALAPIRTEKLLLLREPTLPICPQGQKLWYSEVESNYHLSLIRRLYRPLYYPSKTLVRPPGYAPGSHALQARAFTRLAQDAYWWRYSDSNRTVSCLQSR
jgi:hypothetical protein